MKVSIIVAMSENRVIGENNQIPWRISSDLKLFKRITMGHPIIMGRKTFESIGRILPGREHFIISRQTTYQVAGATVVSSIEQALELCRNKTDEAFIIGGAEIYRQTLAQADRIYLTQIHKVVSGDTFFPDFSRDAFREKSKEDLSEGEWSYSVSLLERI